MLPKSARLGGRSGFESIFRSRKAIFGSEIALFFRFQGEKPARIGFAFKQKTFPRATMRHFLKRKGSAIMRELYGEIPKGTDLIVLFHRTFPEPVTYQMIKASLADLVKRLNKAKKQL